MIKINLDIIYLAYLKSRYNFLGNMPHLAYLIEDMIFDYRAISHFGFLVSRTINNVIMDFTDDDVKELLEKECQDGVLDKLYNKYLGVCYRLSNSEENLNSFINNLDTRINSLSYYHPFILYKLGVIEDITKEEIDDFLNIANK